MAADDEKPVIQQLLDADDDGKLTFERFAACLEIDGTGKAMQLVGKLARGGYGRNQFVQTAGTGGGIG